MLVLLSLVFQAAGFVVTFWYVTRTARVLRGAIIGWGVMVLCAFLASVPVPEIAAKFGSEYRRVFPEAIVVPPTVVFGWIPAALTAILASYVRRRTAAWWPHTREQGRKQGADSHAKRNAE
jgi:hypothetical protein